jgi:heme exporter protein B
MMQDIFEIAFKDLKIEFRTKNTITFMILFGLITSMMFSISVPLSAVRDVAPGLLWLVFLFVGLLGFSRAFLRELEMGTLDGLKIAPVSPADILLGKIIYNLVLVLIIELIVFPLFIGLFDLRVENLFLAFGVITLGNVGFVVVSSSLSPLVLKAKSRELLIPIILFPVIYPIISSTISALSTAIKGGGLMDTSQEIVLILSFTIIMLTVSLLTFDHALED